MRPINRIRSSRDWNGTPITISPSAVSGACHRICPTPGFQKPRIRLWECRCRSYCDAGPSRLVSDAVRRQVSKGVRRLLSHQLARLRERISAIPHIVTAEAQRGTDNRTAVGSNDLRRLQGSDRAHRQNRRMPQQRAETEPAVRLGVCRSSAVCDGRCDALRRSGCRADCIWVRWQNRKRETPLANPESCRDDQAAWLSVDYCWRRARAGAFDAGERRLCRLQTR